MLAPFFVLSVWKARECLSKPEQAARRGTCGPVQFGAALVLLCAAATGLEAATIGFTADFDTTVVNSPALGFNQRIWDVGFDKSFRFGGVRRVLGGRFGMEVSGSASAYFGLGAEGLVGAENYDVRYPVNVSLGLPDLNKPYTPGDQLTITTAWSPDSAASMRAWGDDGYLRLYADVRAHLGIGGRACVVGCVSGSGNFNFDRRLTLLGIESQDFNNRTFDILPYLSANVNWPRIDANGGLQGTRLIASDRDSAVGLTLDVPRAITEATGIPLKGSIGLGPIRLEGSIFDLDLGLDLGFRQDFSFDATPTIVFDTNVGRYAVKAGDSLTLTMPDVPLQINTIVSLDDNSLSARSLLDLDATLDFDLLRGSLSLWRRRIASVGPIYSTDGRWDLGDIAVANKNWALDFKEYRGPEFQFVPVPEPATNLLIGAGLVAMACLRRRCRSIA